MRFRYYFPALLVILTQGALSAPRIDDQDLQKSVDELSASTLAGGPGWTAYEHMLHPDYHRWAMGHVYEGRDKFVRSLEQWWDHGMRVAQRDIELVAVNRLDDLAVIRYRVTEQFVGPDGPAGGFSGFVSNTWVRDNGQWLLWSAEISPNTSETAD